MKYPRILSIKFLGVFFSISSRNLRRRGTARWKKNFENYTKAVKGVRNERKILILRFVGKYNRNFSASYYFTIVKMLQVGKYNRKNWIKLNGNLPRIEANFETKNLVGIKAYLYRR